MDAAKTLEGIKTGTLIEANGVTFKLGRRSHSKKYNVTTVALTPVGGLQKVKIFIRATVTTISHAGCGEVLTSLVVLG